MFKIFITLMFMASLTFGQHFSVSLGKNALDKIINSGIESYSDNDRIPTYVIPASTSHLVITKEEINSYEIVNEIKKYVNIDLSKDFHYSLKWSPMTVEFTLRKDSFKYDFEGDSSDFTVWAKAKIETVRISGSSFEICETLDGKCIKQNGAYVKIKNFSIKLKDRNFIDAIVALNIKNNDEKVIVKNTALYSSLFKPSSRRVKNIYSKFDISNVAPKLDVYFSDIFIPAPILIVGNRKVQLNTSGLKHAILSQKDFLASQLLHIVGGFISTDLSEIVTSGVMGDLSEITKRIDLFNFTNTRVAIGPKLKDDYYPSYITNYKEHSSNIQSELLSMVLDMINYTEVDLEYLTLRSSNDESITFDYNIHAELNNRSLNTENTILNGIRDFSAPKFDQLSKSFDIALAIGEPFLNGVLDSAIESGIVEKIFKEQANIPGLKIESLKVHFDQRSSASFSSNVIKVKKELQRHTKKVAESTSVKIGSFKNKFIDKSLKEYDLGESYNTGTFTLVANVQLDLSKLPSDGLGDKLKNFVASSLESDIVWFPIELTFRPLIKSLNGKSYLSLTYVADSSSTLKNTYGYPMKKMFGIVEEGIVDNLNESLFAELENEIQLDISDYIKLPGLNAIPVGVEFLKSGHMSLMLNVKNLNLKEIVDHIGGM